MLPFKLTEIEVHPANIKLKQEYLIELSGKKKSRFVVSTFSTVWYGYVVDVGWYNEQFNYHWDQLEKNPDYYKGSYDERENLKNFKRIWIFERIPESEPKPEGFIKSDDMMV